MSIIYDALKKSETKSGKTSKFRTCLISALALCLGIFIAKIFLSVLTGPIPRVNHASNITQIPLLKQEVSPLPPLVNLTALPKTKSLAKDESVKGAQEQLPVSLILSGIFFSGDERYALINNKIVKEQDVIEGLKVIAISNEEVELKSGDSVIKLSTSAK